MRDDKYEAERIYRYDPHAYGNARWATPDDLEKRGYGPHHENLIAYRLPEHNKAAPVPITTNSDAHIAYIGTTRSGKDTTGIIRSYLEHEGPIVVLDCKNGEGALITALYRQNVLKRKVYIIDKDNLVASKLGLKRSRLNPVDLIDPDSPHVFDLALNLADAIIMDQDSKEKHWPNSAIALTAGLLIAIKAIPLSLLPAPKKGRNLGQLRSIINLPRKKFQEFLVGQYREEKSEDGKVERELVRPGMVHSHNMYVRNAAHRIMGKNLTELNSILSTIDSNTWWLESEAMQEALSQSDFDISELEDGNTDLYFIFSANNLHLQSRFMRVATSHVLTTVNNFQKKPKHNILLILQEMFAMGHQRNIESAIGTMAGLGITLVYVLQDINQLQSLYPQTWKTALANTSRIHCMAANDPDTAELIAKYCGKTTIQFVSQTTQEKRAGLLTDPNYLSKNDLIAGTELMPPSSVMTLPRTRQIIYLNGAGPCLAYKIPYFLDAKFRDQKTGLPLFSIHPDHEDRPLPPAYDFSKPGLDIDAIVAPYLVGV